MLTRSCKVATRFFCVAIHADNRLDQELLARGAAIEFLLNQLAQRRPDAKAYQHVEWDRGEHDQGQRPRIGEQNTDEHEGEYEVDRREQGLSGEEPADRLQFHYPCNGLPGRPGLEIGDRQAQKMCEQALPKLDIDPIGGVGKRIDAQVLKRDVEHADHNEPAAEHEQGLVATMGEDLIDDHLEEQRRREAEDRYEQRRRQNMTERTAITPDGRQKPAEAEQARIGAGAADPASEQERAPADQARDVLERGLLDRVLIGSTSRQSPNGLRSANSMSAPLVMRTIAGVGKVMSRSAVTWATRRALSPTSLAARMRSASLAWRAPSASSRASCTGSALMR
jgi:hypothetical protein